MTSTPESVPPGPRPRRPRRLLLLLLAAVVACALALGYAVVGGTDGSSADADARATSAPDSDEVTPTPPLVAPADPAAPPVAADALPAALPSVGLDEPVAIDGVTASLGAVELVEAEATGRGSVAGPAVRVTVRVQNGTDAELALDAVSVNATFGAEQTPASPVEDPSRRMFAGTLAPGAAGEAVYVFSVPAASQELVGVQVGYRPGAPLAVFSGTPA